MEDWYQSKLDPRKKFLLLHWLSAMFYRGPKKYRKNGAKEIMICPSSSCLLSIFFNIMKKLKFVEWFSWCNTPCLWEESKFSSPKIGFLTLVNTLRCVLASFVACAGQQWHTGLPEMDGSLRQPGYYFPNPPGQWIQILYTYQYKTAKYIPNP